MSLYGINAYTSNYSSMYSGLYGSNKNKNSYGTSSADLLALAKKVDMVRSKSFKKNALEEFRKAFSSTDSESNSESVAKLSQNATSLSKNATDLLAKAGDFSNTDKTMSAIQKFVDSYNSTLDGIQNSDSTAILEKGVSIVNTTKAYARTLARAGIFVGSDNRLTVKEDNVKTADPGALKALFSGSYSYASKIADKASFVSRSASLQSQLSYNSKGNAKGLDFYNQLVNSIFESKV